MNFESPIISVIIPIHNIEDYLEKCLSTVANQTLQKELYEVILINDCSTDNSYKTITQFKAKCDNFKVITNKKRIGIGPSRNVGITESRGEYLFFIDGDDYIEQETLELLLSLAKSDNSDIVTSGFHRVTKEGEIRFSKNDYLSMNSDKEEMLCEFFSNQISSTAWGKLYKKSLFLDNKIKYPKGIHEDISVTFKLFWYANKISKDIKNLYFWVERDTSTTALMTKDHISGWFNGISIQKKFINENHGITIKHKLKSAINHGLLVASSLLLERIEKIKSHDDESRKILYSFLFRKLKSFSNLKMIITSNKEHFIHLHQFYSIFSKTQNKYKAMLQYESK